MPSLFRQALVQRSDGLGPQLSDIAEFLPDSFMTTFFVEYHLRKAQKEDSDNLERVECLSRLFPGSIYLLIAKALNKHGLMSESDS